MVSNVICKALGIRYPIVLGGLAGIGTARLAAAVSEAGGLGLLGSAPWNGKELERQIRRTRELTGAVFGVNIPIPAEHAEELVETVIAQEIPVVVTAAGNPRLYTSKLKDNGVFVMQVVPTVTHATGAAQAGVDAIVAEGAESGGRVSAELISTLVLVPQVVDAVSCPVIAAGGIGDGRGLAAAMALGAAGVQMGTAFLASEECQVSRAFKELLILARETDTKLTVRGKGGRRSLKQTLIDQHPELRAGADSSRPLASIGAGQVAGLVHAVRPVREIIGDMIREARAALVKIGEGLPET